MLFWVSKTSCIKNSNLNSNLLKQTKPHDIIKYAKDVLQKVQNFLSYTQIANEDLALADLLQKVEIDMDTYMQALQISQKGHRIILQWNPCDIFKNPCHQVVLHLWRGNIDLQYVEDEYSTIMYVCSYMMKSEKSNGGSTEKSSKKSVRMMIYEHRWTR